MDIDKPLDEIVLARRQSRKKRDPRASARTQLLGHRNSNAMTRARVSAQITKQPANATSDKIIVSNLPQDVNEAQVKELFHTTVGPLRAVSIHCDSSGKSKGIAEVSFQRKGDTTKAFQQYNNRLIDGKRPMKIEIILDPSKPQPLAARVGPPATGSTAEPRAPTRRLKKSGIRTKQTPKTAADLDAEMEDYTARSAAPTGVIAGSTTS